MLLFAALVPVSLVYAFISRLRALLFESGMMASFSLPRPVISVGNLSVGGTGKTPMVTLLARKLIAKGKKVAVLSRGYGGPKDGEVRFVSDGSAIFLPPSESADEPFLLARSVPGLIVVTGRDRYHAGRRAFERYRPDIFILDDGYQHLRLRRDLNILLLDAGNPFGNGWTLPAGLLREPPSAVRRADLVIYTRSDSSMDLKKPRDIPACRSFHRLAGFVPLAGGTPAPFSLLAGKRGVACAGIGDPEAFFAALLEEGLEIVSTLAFRDHCGYDQSELGEIRRALAETGARYLITTEKDAVKLASAGPLPAECYAAVLEIGLLDPEVLERELEKLL